MINSHPEEFSVTVVITTRNRKFDICRAIDSVLRQTIPCEILVMDDASDDGTAGLIKEKYPNVRVIESNLRVGLIVQRNRAAKIALGSYLVSLDDDAVLVEKDTLERAISYFCDSKVGAVAMPIINVIDGNRTQLGVQAPNKTENWITNTYIGAAHALRKDLFLSLGGYEEALFQWGEEENYCQKLYANGYVVCLANCGFTEHYPNPVGRHKRKKNVWIYRNSILNIWFYAPLVLVPGLWAFESAKWIYSGLREIHKMPVIFEGLFRGYCWAFMHPHYRKPIVFCKYINFLKLKFAKCKKLSDFIQN